MHAVRGRDERSAKGRGKEVCEVRAGVGGLLVCMQKRGECRQTLQRDELRGQGRRMTPTVGSVTYVEGRRGRNERYKRAYHQRGDELAREAQSLLKKSTAAAGRGNRSSQLQMPPSNTWRPPDHHCRVEKKGGAKVDKRSDCSTHASYSPPPPPPPSAPPQPKGAPPPRAAPPGRGAAPAR
jgi:hypothetical protein